MNFCQIFDYPIYEVGGCVRDSLLGIPIKDVDITSDLTPKAFKGLCKKLGYRTHDTGIDHGTITVIIKGEAFEHTTFRKDVSCDGRNATIEFSKTIEEDLSRRDFTINAIAKLGEEIIDPFKGREDLKAKKLRTVGNARERFQEDYLRIVRAARFISRLGLTPEKELLAAAHALAPNIIQYVSIERISDEISKAQKHGSQFFIEAEKLGFLKEIFPETLNINSQQKENWLKQIRSSENKPDLQYFAAILIPIYEEKAEKKAAALRMSRQISKGIATFHKLRSSFHASILPSELRDIMIEAKDYYKDLKEYFCEVYDDSDSARAIISRLETFEEKVRESIESPYISGEYLIKSGLKPSPVFKDILDQCGKLQAEGKNEEEVRSFARSLIGKK